MPAELALHDSGMIEHRGRSTPQNTIQSNSHGFLTALICSSPFYRACFICLSDPTALFIGSHLFHLSQFFRCLFYGFRKFRLFGLRKSHFFRFTEFYHPHNSTPPPSGSARPGECISCARAAPDCQPLLRCAILRKKRLFLPGYAESPLHSLCTFPGFIRSSPFVRSLGSLSLRQFLDSSRA